jgi:pyruvate/2-oxoglutarate dehydrogenase complex dihydrolipoamide acyltransferase (E2) component
VGKVIALLAEEGDDISNLEAPKEETAPPKKEEASTSSSSASTESVPPPSSSQPSESQQAHSTIHISTDKPLFPSVYRLLAENNISNVDAIKGTGVRGMLTKGDVLAYLGKASGPLGTYKPGPALPIEIIQGSKKAGAKKEEAKVNNILM